jgi:uncharacterized protein
MITPEPVTAESPHCVKRPVMLQGWYDLAALHWAYEPHLVQRLLPPGFTVDTFDGSAWVGLIAFHMRRIRIPGLPAFGYLSTFPETNLRTYITDPTGRRGVWFFSLDVNRLIPAVVARVSYRLPYCWGHMSIDHDRRSGDHLHSYKSVRRWPRGIADSTVAVRIGRELAESEVTELDHFLSARWALGTRFGRHLMWAKVDHPRWPLHEAEATQWSESLSLAAGLPAPVGEPLTRWSPGVEVSIERPRRVPRSGDLSARRPFR